MKKNKISLGLVTSFIAALALTSCGDETTETVRISESSTSIVDFIGYNSSSEKIEINIDKFYSEYGNDSAGTTLFYNAVLESLIRYEYKGLSEKDQELRAYTSIEKEANDKVSAQQQVASDNAGSDGDYDAEMDKIYKSFNVSDLNGLKQHFIYELEKEALNDWYLKKNLPTLKDQYIGVDSTWSSLEQGGDQEYSSVFPYHILHVLVKLSADADDYSRAKISESEAKKLWATVRKLIDGSYSFEEVAFQESEDSSASDYGDAGIMSTQTSFVNEFKLGIYAYDALLSGVNAEDADNDEIYQAFGLDSDATVKVGTTDIDGSHSSIKEEKVVDLVEKEMVEDVKTAISGYADTDKFEGIASVPYDVFRKLGQYAEEDEANFKMDSGESVYPRNVIFNQFLNFRSPFVITNEDIESLDVDGKVSTKVHNFNSGDLKLADNFQTDIIPNFNKLDSESNKVGILTDKNNDVIIGVRSSYGIHFMVMRKSVFKGTNDVTNYTVTEDDGSKTVKPKSEVSLQDYYTVEVPGSSADYPEMSYVNWENKNDPSYYTNRADTIKNKLSGSDSGDTFDAAYDYRVYETMIEEIGEDKITWFDSSEGATVSKNIKANIAKLRANKFESNLESINSSWEDYIKQLKSQNYLRSITGALLSNKAVQTWMTANLKPTDPGYDKTTVEAARKEFQEGGEYYAK